MRWLGRLVAPDGRVAPRALGFLIVLGLLVGGLTAVQVAREESALQTRLSEHGLSGEAVVTQVQSKPRMRTVVLRLQLPRGGRGSMETVGTNPQAHVGDRFPVLIDPADPGHPLKQDVLGRPNLAGWLALVLLSLAGMGALILVLAGRSR